MSIYSRLASKGRHGFGYGSTAEQVTEDLDLTGRTAVVTGCNSGIGMETCRVLALRGAKVVGLARTLAKAEAALRPMRGSTLGMACELSDPASVRQAVNALRDVGPLHILIANAGIMALPKLQQSHGYELQFFTNHMGHFILVTGLLDQLAEDCRVVMVSSDAHHRAPKEGIQFDNLSGEKGYAPWAAYGQSKLANLLFAKELAVRFAGSDRTANAVHPGVIATQLGRSMPSLLQLGMNLLSPLLLKSVPQGAATQVYVATHPQAAGVSGEFWKDCAVAKPSRAARDPEMARRLWDVSEKIAAEV